MEMKNVARVALTGVFTASTAFTLGIAAAQVTKMETEVDAEAAPITDPYDMNCLEIEGTSGYLQRCTNEEVICYVSRRPRAISCIERTR